MRRIITLVAIVLMLALGNTIKAHNTMTLNEKQQCMVAIACLEAKGNLENLAQAINGGMDAGLTVSEIKEALSQLYAYTGFPRSLNALGTLQQVIKARNETGKMVIEGRDADDLPATYDALKQGTEVQTKLVGGKAFNYEFAPATDYYLKAHLFGDIFARNNLTHAERELVTVSALSGLDGVMPQLVAHVSGARNMGVADEQIKAIPQVLAAKVGLEEAERCTRAIATVFGEEINDAEIATTYKHGIATSPYPIGEFNKDYAQYFIGNSYLAPLDAQNGGPVNVTFEPRCRNNWHIHHKQVQVLVCVAGRGWYQEWGKEPVELVPGTVVAIPAEVKHWHGAARDSWMQHLTYHTHIETGASNEWLEPVSDEHYNKLK
jgi:alkylhydroperoxidase/carboxymuconolactone decarboxylase family protein YurZ/quercetin dioxygenase-like cupin family protein